MFKDDVCALQSQTNGESPVSITHELTTKDNKIIITDNKIIIPGESSISIDTSAAFSSYNIFLISKFLYISCRYLKI